MAEGPNKTEHSAEDVFKVRIADMLSVVKGVPNFVKRLPVDLLFGDEKAEDGIQTQLRNSFARTDSEIFDAAKDNIKRTANENAAVVKYRNALKEVERIEGQVAQIRENQSKAKGEKNKAAFQKDIDSKLDLIDKWQENAVKATETPEYRQAIVDFLPLR